MAEQIIPLVFYDGVIPSVFDSLSVLEFGDPGSRMSVDVTVRKDEDCVWRQHQENLKKVYEGKGRRLFPPETASIMAERHVSTIRSVGQVAAIGIVYDTGASNDISERQISEALFKLRREE